MDTLNKLTGLHGRLADAMSNALDAEVKRIEFTDRLLDVNIKDIDNEAIAKQISNAISLAPTARVDNGLLKTVASFLKDNDITTDHASGNGADETMEKLAKLHAKRRVASTPLDTMN